MEAEAHGSTIMMSKLAEFTEVECPVIVFSLRITAAYDSYYYFTFTAMSELDDSNSSIVRHFSPRVNSLN